LIPVRVERTDGILLVDKPVGPTSHDVVGMTRRALGTRSVGHAGTLDPMASGLLIMLVGEATKLSAYVTEGDKRYKAVLRLGIETDTLDAQGQTVRTMGVPSTLSALELEQVCASFRGRIRQVVPNVSAIKRGGERLYAKARRGESFDAPEREVYVTALSAELDRKVSLTLDVTCSKGCFVRALGRDIATALGTCGHLTALRRLTTGPFDVADAIGSELLHAARSDEAAAHAVRSALRPLEAGVSLPRATLTPAGVRKATHGQPILDDDFAFADPDTHPDLVALFTPTTQKLLAVARRVGETLHVARGFNVRIDPSEMGPAPASAVEE
jgi:tRNA pseudouridine55 synthase